MSGHSKWSTIKHKKGAEDARRGKIFTRIGREISVAAREGGPDVDFNPRLRLAVDRAKAANMPKDNIERAISRGAGTGEDAVIYEEMVYEGYGPNGIAILIDVLTDNKNRALAEVKFVFSRGGGVFANSGAVQWQFDQKGYIEIAKDGVNFDDLFMQAAEAGADDVEEEDEAFAVYTVREAFGAVEKALIEAGYKVADSKLTWLPKNEVELPTDQAVTVVRLIERLEELDDVQGVSSNLSLTEETIAALE